MSARSVCVRALSPVLASIMPTTICVCVCVCVYAQTYC